MSQHLNVLVIGATGQQGGSVARSLLSRGHRVRAVTRNVESRAAVELGALGAELMLGNNEDQDSMVHAAQGMDSAYAMTSFFESGGEAEVRQGKNIADALKVAEIPHFVYASVASADRSTGIAHFESKYEVEQHIKHLGVPHTIVAPAFFTDNLLSPWTLPGLTRGILALAVPPDLPIQQIPVVDIASFVALVLEYPSRFLGQRIDVASYELSGRQMAEIISSATGHRIDFTRIPIAEASELSADAARMYEWFDEVGYSVDIKALRRDYPEAGWQSFEQWVSIQNWNVLDG